MTRAETFYQGATGAESGEEGAQLIKKIVPLLIYDRVFFFLGQSAGMRPAASCRASE